MSEDISLITMDRINELQTVIDSLRSEINDLKTYMNGVISTEIANINSSIAANDATCLHKANTETANGAKTFSGGLTCSNDFNLSGQYFGTNISNQTLDANNLWVKLNGATKIYYTTSDGATANITNLATTNQVKLISETVRYMSDTDYKIYQTATQNNVRYERTCTNGTWTAWTNENSRIISIMNSNVKYSIDSSKATDMTISTEYTMPYDAYVCFESSAAHGGMCYMTVNGVIVLQQGAESNQRCRSGSAVVIKKGDKVKLYTNGGNATFNFAKYFALK